MNATNTAMIDKTLHKIDDLFTYADQYNFGDLHLKVDKATGLHAIIAIHSTKLGPALGGCRFAEYPSTDAAIIDAMRLARGMSYKAAITGLDLGGGKAVIIKPPIAKDRDALFAAFGRFVNELGGRYITAQDSGTSPHDMESIYQATQYVAPPPTIAGAGSNPSPYTADGVLRGIEAAIKFKLNSDSLENVHIAMQGAGDVSYYLAKGLHARGAKLTVCDIKSHLTQRFVDEFAASVVKPSDIYSVECDVFAPCALGAALNDQTIPLIKAPIVSGCANNQLAHQYHSQTLKDHDIIYTPDYVVNAGGLIHAVTKYNQTSDAQARKTILNIYDSTLMILERAAAENKTTTEVANIIARERLHG